MKKLILTIIMFLSAFYVKAQMLESHKESTEDVVYIDWKNTFEEAVAEANEENKPILIYFTGSDWCGPCKKLDKELFHTDKFKVFSEEKLVLYTANFPMNRDLVSKENTKSNKQLSKKYNQESFPTMIIIDKKGKVLGRKNGSYMAEYYYPFFEEVVRNNK